MKRYHVMLIDDDPEQCELYRLALAQVGLEAHVFTNSRSALTALAQRPYDLVLADWAMPEIEGDLLVAEIRRQYPQTRTILMSSHAHVETAAEEVEADAWYCKNQGLAELRATILRLLNHVADETEAEGGDASDPLVLPAIPPAMTGPLANATAAAIFQAIPVSAVLVDRRGVIAAANARFLQAFGLESSEAVAGLRVGEAVECVCASNRTGGCGVGTVCADCGLITAIHQCLGACQSALCSCHLRTHAVTDGGALDLEARVTPLPGAHDLALLTLRDISDERRRHVLEHLCFHDLLIPANGLQVVAHLMDYEEIGPLGIRQLSDAVNRLANRLVREITWQQQLVQAEQGLLQLEPLEITLAEVLREMKEYYAYREQERQCRLRIAACPDGVMITDSQVLYQVLGNLVENAIEATPAGGEVTLGARLTAYQATFTVQNPTVIPSALQRQLFRRSFSTKAPKGRGIGTYSARLLTERYLNGTITFASQDPGGTIFTVTLPRELIHEE